MSHQDDVFVRLFIGILVILTIFTIGAIVLGNIIGDVEQESIAALKEQKPAATEAAKPAAAQPAKAQPAPKAEADAPKSGQEVIQSACAACHTAGVAGAPKLGDTEAWSKRAEKGLDTLVQNSINGIGAMPPRGGNMNLSDEELRKAVEVMLANAGVEAGAGGSGDGGAAANGGDGDQAGTGNGQGQEVYAKACKACHATGAVGAPVLGNQDHWEPRLAKGKETLYDHSINGFNAMPPKGGWTNLSDAEVKAAVDYMIAASR